MNLTEWARLQGMRPQIVYRWFRDDRLPVPAVRVNARTVLIAPDATLTPASRAAASRAGDCARSGPRSWWPDRPARVRTRLRLSAQDEAVLQAAGRHLGSLASADLTARCAEGRLDAKGRAVSRAARKRALTAASSSRWAGAITRTTEDQWQLSWRNLHAENAGLRARVRVIEARLAVPAGATAGRVRGYATQADRYGKQARLQVLTARQAAAGQRITHGQVSVTRGGRRLLRTRANLAAAGLTADQWRAEWDAARLFLTADGEKDKAWGNETIRFHPDEGWLEVKLPRPLGPLANRPHGRYRLTCPVTFPYRGDEVAAQAAPRAPQPRRRTRNSGPPQAWRQPPGWRKTVPAPGTSPPDQAAQHRSGPPTEPTPVIGR